ADGVRLRLGENQGRQSRAEAISASAAAELRGWRRQRRTQGTGRRGDLKGDGVRAGAVGTFGNASTGGGGASR
ncbi:MAG: hypothetical protein BJ554DRAFT_2502, partial [Olpidium bornovanus]